MKNHALHDASPPPIGHTPRHGAMITLSSTAAMKMKRSKPMTTVDLATENRPNAQRTPHRDELLRCSKRRALSRALSSLSRAMRVVTVSSSSKTRRTCAASSSWSRSTSIALAIGAPSVPSPAAPPSSITYSESIPSSPTPTVAIVPACFIRGHSRLSTFASPTILSWPFHSAWTGLSRPSYSATKSATARRRKVHAAPRELSAYATLPPPLGSMSQTCGGDALLTSASETALPISKAHAVPTPCRRSGRSREARSRVAKNGFKISSSTARSSCTNCCCCCCCASSSLSTTSVETRRAWPPRAEVIAEALEVSGATPSMAALQRSRRWKQNVGSTAPLIRASRSTAAGHSPRRNWRGVWPTPS